MATRKLETTKKLGEAEDAARRIEAKMTKLESELAKLDGPEEDTEELKYQLEDAKNKIPEKLAVALDKEDLSAFGELFGQIQSQQVRDIFTEKGNKKFGKDGQPFYTRLAGELLEDRKDANLLRAIETQQAEVEAMRKWLEEQRKVFEEKARSFTKTT